MASGAGRAEGVSDDVTALLWSDVLLSCGVVLASPAAFAERSAALDRASLWLGGYYANTDVSLHALTNNGALGGSTDLESGNETVARARSDLLVLDSQGFSFDYYSLGASSSSTIDHAFDYDGEVHGAGLTLNGKLDLDAGSAAWHGWFGNDSDAFGIGLGASYFKVELGVDGTASVNGEDTSANVRWNEDAVAPLLSVAHKHAFSDSLRV